MSDIIINQNNLHRFNKRLKRALSQHFNQDVPLHIASDLFAKALGVDNVYELDKKIKKIEENNNIKQTNNYVSDSYGMKAQMLLDELKAYFSNNLSDLWSVSFIYLRIDNYFYINIVGQSAQYEDQASFGLYFQDNPNYYLEKELSNLKYLPEDKLFLNKICKTYFTEDRAENTFLGELIKMLIKDNMHKDNEGNQYYTLFEKNNPSNSLNKLGKN